MNFLRSLIAGIVLSIFASGAALAQCGTTAPANKVCGNSTGSSGLASWISVPPSALSPIAGGTLLGNNGTSSAVPTALSNPVLGIPGSVAGSLRIAGATSGSPSIVAQSVAGSPTLTLPTASGTFAVGASSPLLLNATTGALTCPTCVTSSGGGAITGVSPISVSAAGAVSIPSLTGTGSTVVLQTSPTLVTPVLGVATGTSLALGGATIGSNALAVTGSTNLTPTANTLTQALIVGQTLPSGNAGLNNPYSANYLSVTNNGYMTPPGGATDSFGNLPVVAGLRVDYSSAGSGAGQFPIQVGALFAARATSRGQQLVGLNGTVYTNINSAGEDAFWGGISLANAGPSSNVKALWGHDAEVGAQTGAVVPIRVGVGSTSVGPVTGTTIDSAFVATACCANVGTAAPWVNALVLYKSDTMSPVSGSIIISNAAFTMQYGLKLDNITFAQKIFDFGATVHQLDGVGNVTYGGSGSFGDFVQTTKTTNAPLTFQATNTSTGTAATTSITFTNSSDQAAFGLAGTNYTTLSQLQNRAYIHSGSATNGIILDAAGSKPIDFYQNNSRVGGFTGAGALTLTSPLGVASGGTGITSLGVGVATALGVNVGNVGSFVTNGGALGTPSSATLTNATGLPTTGLTGTLQAAQEPAHTGGCTNSAGSLALSCNINTTINGGGATNTIVAGATGWVGVGLICNATESFCFIPQPQAGTISRLYVNVNAAPGAGQQYTVKMRKNSTDQTVTCPISGASSTSCNDTSNSFTVAAGDNVSVQITSSAGAATVSVANFGFRLVTTTP